MKIKRISRSGVSQFWAKVGTFCLLILVAWHLTHRSASAVSGSGHSAGGTVVKQPNVILIITDDQGYGDVGAHGNSMIRTPNLDDLYKQSIRLTDFHVDPTCSETRSALMTGRYSSRTGVWHTIMGRSILRRDEVTLADVFRANGYRTGMFGKWHLGDNYPYRPQDRGFDRVLNHGGGGVGQTPDLWGNDYFDDRYFRDGAPEPQEGYCTDVFFDGAIEFIDADRSSPFFCYLATNAPHGPFLVDESYSQPYVEAGVPETMAKFYGMITNIDENLGKLMRHLDETGRAENTILIFMTDNGTAAGVARNDRNSDKWAGFNAGMRGRKGSQYDGGHRVPCFIRWPGGNLLVNTDRDLLAAHLDLMPTLVGLCGLEPPTGVAWDGIDLTSVLRGETEGPRDRTLFVHSQRLEHPRQWKKCSVMTDRWRLVDGEQLYDITADPGQTTDVAADNPAVVASLRERYLTWWDSISTRFDEYVRIDVGADESPEVFFTCHDWHTDNGPVPWNQGHIRNDLVANGWWQISVVKDGTYEFVLRSRPNEGDGVLVAAGGKARLQIGETSISVPVEAGASEAKIVMELREGDYSMQTWLEGESEPTRGAYFVIARRVGGGSQPSQVVEFEPNDRIAFVGGTFIERMQSYNYLETLLTAAAPDLNLTFRNLGWSGDDVTGLARAVFGNQQDGFQRLLRDLRTAEPNVVVLAYGSNEAFGGEANIDEFFINYQRLIDEVRQITPRMILITPYRLQDLGHPLPSPAEANLNIERYADAIAELGDKNKLPVIRYSRPLGSEAVLAEDRPAIRDRLTDNGLHFNEYGYWRTAPRLARYFARPLPLWRVSGDYEEQRIEANGTQASDIEFVADRVSFTCEDESLPMPAPPETAPRGGKMTAPHDRLQIKNLPAGRWGLNINGQPTVLATHDQWERGVYFLRSDYLPQTEQLRTLIAEKNELFFHRHRPQNETYLFLFRKHEQGNNAVEIPQFDPLIEEHEDAIRKAARPTATRYELVKVGDIP